MCVALESSGDAPSSQRCICSKRKQEGTSKYLEENDKTLGRNSLNEQELALNDSHCEWLVCQPNASEGCERE